MWLPGIVPQEIGGMTSRIMSKKVNSKAVLAVVNVVVAEAEETAATEVDWVDVDAKQHMCFKTAICVMLKKKKNQ